MLTPKAGLTKRTWILLLALAHPVTLGKMTLAGPQAPCISKDGIQRHVTENLNHSGVSKKGSYPQKPNALG